MRINMKNLFKRLLVLALILALLVSTTSCDVLADFGIGVGNTNGGNGNLDNELNDEVIDEVTGEVHRHIYVADIVSATCTESGKITYTCECGKITTSVTSAKGHSYEADTCTVCGYVNPDYVEELPEEEAKEIFDGGILYLPNEEDPITSDPYVNVDVSEFYANYTPAISYMDAYYRTQHNLMSGTIDTQTANPTISAYQPTEDGKLVRNTAYVFSEDGLIYYVVDAYGNIVKEIYKCGSYIMLEEVAAYVFAFGTYPTNHSANKKEKPSSSPWGKYLRVNHTNFTGDTSKYPYEPELPNITGCGGDLYYYEMDIGTTGYNNGSSISRGACRIVYTRKDLDGDGVIEVNETYLFYTQNHYHDFREYLNYEGGWGTLFGDEAGGGVSRPTPYPETSYYSFVYTDGTPIGQVTEIVVLWLGKSE